MNETIKLRTIKFSLTETMQFLFKPLLLLSTLNHTVFENSHTQVAVIPFSKKILTP